MFCIFCQFNIEIDSFVRAQRVKRLLLISTNMSMIHEHHLPLLLLLILCSLSLSLSFLFALCVCEFVPCALPLFLPLIYDIFKTIFIFVVVFGWAAFFLLDVCFFSESFNLYTSLKLVDNISTVLNNDSGLSTARFNDNESHTV